MMLRKEYRDRIEFRNEQGYLHRIDGPAIEWKSGHKEWYINGQRHREDGPAVIFSNNERYVWNLNGIEYSEQEWEQEVAKIKLKRILEL
jgi:hypothetical protein